MPNRLFFVLLLASLSACNTTDPPSDTLRLRVLTYNIHHGEGTDGVFDYPRLADIIKRAQPDLVALQEVDVKTRRAGGVDQAARLGELTGMHHAFAEAMPYQGGSYGEAVLSRMPIRAFYNHKLPHDEGHEPRSAAVASVAQWRGEPPVVFAGTHLCHQSAQTRLRQVRSIVGHRAYEGPLTVLAGDFNFTPDSDAYRVMIDAGWVDAAAAFGDPRPTIPADEPTRRIDYVFVRPAEAWRVVDVQVLDEPVASDHAPVLVVLEYISPEP
ncbi:MAG: endonuclease/exonuclease/phosphatase family protein [Phycisphaeraceae bacterium]